MFGLFRRRVRAQPPLRTVGWDGHALDLHVEPDFRGEITVDLDGVFFASAPTDDRACVRFAFPFSPSGHAAFCVLPRLGRDGAPLLDAPMELRVGQAGVRVATAMPPALAPLVHPAKTVPFGVELAAIDVVVVVPVFNAPELVRRCLDSVLAHSHRCTEVLVIDDASTDPAIAPLLAEYASRPGVHVARNERNLGFTATANRGFREAGRADVVLLNADTEVGANWLTGLRRAANAAGDIATATAVSDHAGAFSVPELEQDNPLPARWPFDACARALWQDAGLAYPELPTGNGFCLYVKRSVLDRVGSFDEAAFPQGYGEENDFCQRASAQGFRHVVAGNVLVRHARSASFGAERRRALGEAGMAVLRARWPQYEADVARTLFSFERRALDWRVRRVYAQADTAPPPKPRLLWVGADAPRWPDAEVWTLRAVGDRNELAREGVVVAHNVWSAADAETSYRVLWDWLQLHAIERLIVVERKESAAEIVCRWLDLPIAEVAVPFAATAREALAHAFPAFAGEPA